MLPIFLIARPRGLTFATCGILVFASSLKIGYTLSLTCLGSSSTLLGLFLYRGSCAKYFGLRWKNRP